jgi:hypothetical protein
MKILTLALFNLILGMSLNAGADPAPAAVPAPPADPVADGVPILQSSYIDFASLHYKAGDHLADLIARSDGKISLLPPEVIGPVPIMTAALPDGIAYWRLGSFTPKKNWDDLAGDLRTMIDYQHVYGAILDLRSNLTPEDYAGAAQVAAFFSPGDTRFFKYLPQKGDGCFHLPMMSDRAFQGPLVVLTNGQTSGAAEALAASLKADGALIVGRPTAGTSSFFEKQTLLSGQILRFAVAGPTLADGTALLGHPIEPDIALSVEDHAEKVALTLIRDGHVADVTGELPERHRMSEASLVQGQDPEWDDYLTSLEDKPVLLSLPNVHDSVLIGAIDSLRAIRLSQRTAAMPAQMEASTPTPAPLSTSVQ